MDPVVVATAGWVPGSAGEAKYVKAVSDAKAAAVHIAGLPLSTDKTGTQCPFFFGAKGSPCRAPECGSGARGSKACRSIIVKYCQGFENVKPFLGMQPDGQQPNWAASPNDPGRNMWRVRISLYLVHAPTARPCTPTLLLPMAAVARVVHL